MILVKEVRGKKANLERGCLKQKMNTWPTKGKLRAEWEISSFLSETCTHKPSLGWFYTLLLLLFLCQEVSVYHFQSGFLNLYDFNSKSRAQEKIRKELYGIEMYGKINIESWGMDGGRKKKWRKKNEGWVWIEVMRVSSYHFDSRRNLSQRKSQSEEIFFNPCPWL